MTKYLANEILKILSSMHEAGYSHSDVKLDNIIITNQGDVKLIDFGTCHDLNQTKNGKTIEKKGTHMYMCPDLFKNYIYDQPYEYQPVQADMFALGVTLLIIQFGQFPFGDAATFDQLYMGLIGRTHYVDRNGYYNQTGEDHWTYW